MAQRRMFAKTIIDSDAFIDMPLSTQALYFHLGMQSDDDGFVNNPRKIQRMIGASEDDLKVLVAKRFIIPFESGIVVIRHWKINNFIRSDRYNATAYTAEKALLSVSENGEYTVGIPSGNQNAQFGIPSDTKWDTQVRLGKDRLNQDSIERGSNRNRKRFTPPKVKEVEAYCREHSYTVDAQRFVDFYESKGWRVGTTPMRDWKAAIRTWQRRESEQASTRPRQNRAVSGYAQSPIRDEDVSNMVVNFDD